MKRIKAENPNTKTYWNGVYGGDENRVKYEVITRGYNGQSKRMDYALAQINPTDKVLDIGCGIGMFTKSVKDTYPETEVWGTDISSQAIQENSVEHEDITYLHRYIGRQEGLPENYFDVVFCGEVIEHLEEPQLVFTDAQRVLKPGGKLIITTPQENRIQSDEHIWSYTKEDVQKLFMENGFTAPEFIDLPDLEHWYVIFGVGIKI